MADVLTGDDRHSIDWIRREANKAFYKTPRSTTDGDGLSHGERHAWACVLRLLEVIDAIEQRAVPVPEVDLWMLKTLVENTEVMETWKNGEIWCNACESEVADGHGGPHHHMDGCPYQRVIELVSRHEDAAAKK